jgi:hypothetical protein
MLRCCGNKEFYFSKVEFGAMGSRKTAFKLFTLLDTTLQICLPK